MRFPRTALSEWAWAGKPERRFILSLAATAIVVLVPWLAGASVSLPLIAMFVGWDLGSWFMDRLYVDRLSRREIIPG